ncbi:hypothetical protein GCM10009543_22190 [Leifsonia naganoensis]
MSAWLDAERNHRRILAAFECVPKAAKKRLGMGSVLVPDDPQPWGTKVQKLVRGMRTPLRDGSIVRLRVSADGERVDAVMVMKAHVRSRDARFDLAIAARHVGAWGLGMGGSILDCFDAECRGVLRKAGLAEGGAVTVVHRLNTPMQVLLRSRGWSYLGPVENDLEYAYWAITITA